MLSNLLGNSIKFTPEGGTVTLRARSRDGVLSVTIADTGRGIAPEHLAHIFDRYWRPKGSEGEGTGLGLYIARGIVEAHGGRVWAESSPKERPSSSRCRSNPAATSRSRSPSDTVAITPLASQEPGPTATM